MIATTVWIMMAVYKKQIVCVCESRIVFLFLIVFLNYNIMHMFKPSLKRGIPEGKGFDNRHKFSIANPAPIPKKG